MQEIRVADNPPNSAREIFFSLAGVTTANLPRNASAGEVENSLLALEFLEPQHLSQKYVRVSGNRGGPWTVTFTGRLSGVDMPAMSGGHISQSGSLVLGADTQTKVEGKASFQHRSLRIRGVDPRADIMASGILPISRRPGAGATATPGHTFSRFVQHHHRRGLPSARCNGTTHQHQLHIYQRRHA